MNVACINITQKQVKVYIYIIYYIYKVSEQYDTIILSKLRIP